MLVICEYAIAYFAQTRISHIFPHIMAFSKLHMQKLYHMCKNLHVCRIFLYVRSHFLAFSLSNIILRLLNILATDDYLYLQLDIQ